MPLVDLVSASHVSKPWRDAVSSSLHHRKKPKPWLIIRTQSTRHPHATATHAYDPRSDVWIKISQPPIKHISTLTSSHSNFLYMLSPSKFSFSSDPLNFSWHHIRPPRVWRRDLIVARVGDSVVIAGGGCDYVDDPMAVEIYDLKTGDWHRCDSMPGSLKDSSASDWLSIATTTEKLIVTERESGLTHWFDPRSKSWSEPICLDPGDPVTSYNIGSTSNGLVLVGVCRIQNVERVKIWRFGIEDYECEEIGEMPVEYVEKLKNESFGDVFVDIRVGGNMVYVYSRCRWGMEEEVVVVVVCELMEGGGGCRWWSVRNAAAREGMTAERMVFACSEVGMSCSVLPIIIGDLKLRRSLDFSGKILGHTFFQITFGESNFFFASRWPSA